MQQLIQASLCFRQMFAIYYMDCNVCAVANKHDQNKIKDTCSKTKSQLYLFFAFPELRPLKVMRPLCLV